MKEKKANLFDSIPEELQDLQLTEEEIGMIYSGEDQAAPLRCPFCGNAYPNAMTLARHKALCPENPDKKKQTSR